MKTAHALLAPSAAYRWMTCPGSVALSKDLPDDANEYSAEGTAAHQLATWCLPENKDAAAYAGRTIKVEGFEFEVDDEMIEEVQKYLDHVREYAGDSQLLVEQKVSIDHITGEKDAEGTSDVIIIADNGDELQVHDLKYGKGVRVDAEENEQLMLYALGTLHLIELIGYSPKRIRLVIHQPRLDHLSEWDCTLADLEKFAKRAKERAFHALATLDEKPEAIVHHLKPSEQACQFCKAKAICPKLAQFVAQNVGADFDTIVEFNAVPHPADEKQVWTPPVLSTAMKAIGLIEEWCRAIRAKVESELLAGNEVPGYKLVQGKKGNRKWSSEDDAVTLFKSFRLKHEQMYSYKIVSPTQAEKLFKEEPKRWEKLDKLITQSPGKASVAPMSDKRPALVVGKVEEDFENIAEAGADLV